MKKVQKSKNRINCWRLRAEIRISTEGNQEGTELITGKLAETISWEKEENGIEKINVWITIWWWRIENRRFLSLRSFPQDITSSAEQTYDHEG